MVSFGSLAEFFLSMVPDFLVLLSMDINNKL